MGNLAFKIGNNNESVQLVTMTTVFFFFLLTERENPALTVQCNTLKQQWNQQQGHMHCLEQSVTENVFLIFQAFQGLTLTLCPAD